jgi:PhnB protein
MTIRAATPYLILNGRAEAAIELYRSALGANLEGLQRFGDVMGSCPEARRQNVMHASLRVGDAILMLSDGPGEGPIARAGAVSVALDLDDADQMRRAFDALAAQGTVVERIFDAPWGALFGVVQDQFGVSWMLNCAKQPS